MKVIFLGVGEAFDEDLVNTSILVETQVGGKLGSILLDCGFTVPPSFWKKSRAPQELDLVWISHFHGDHFCGLPMLFLRFWESGRTKPLVLVGQAGLRDVARSAMELAYPGFLAKLTFPLEFTEVEPGQTFQWEGLRFSFAESDHSLRDLAVRLDDGRRSLFYSGDGRATARSLLLARGCDLVIHESFRWEEATHGHGSVEECMRFAQRAEASRLALVHIQRDERKRKGRQIEASLKEMEGVVGMLPRPGDEITLS